MSERLDFVEEPGLIGVEFLGRGLLGGSTEELALQPPVLLLKQGDALFAGPSVRLKGAQAAKERFEIFGFCLRWCARAHARDYSAIDAV
jgi:hypothetical protein